MQGKTFLTSIFCATRCILFPESKIIIASGIKSQAREVIEKLDDLRKNSPNLAREISFLSTNTNDARIEFHNGSWIKIVASGDSARGKRSNVLVIDEFRMVDEDIINKVLRKFQSAPRQPKYLNKKKYEHLKERNKELYLSSCWYKFHWCWDKVQAFFKAMAEGKSYFLCGLPYQLAIKEGLLDEEAVKDEMSESNFDAIGWLMEMDCLFFGESSDAFFKLEDIHKNRVLTNAIYPKSTYELFGIKDKAFKYEPKKDGEIRIVSCDIATMKGKGNDASAYTVMRLIPRNKKYDRQIVYMESLEGGHTKIQAIRIRQLMEEFDCDYIVLDTNGVGMGVYDALADNLYDKENQKQYDALSCVNNEEMAERCLEPNAPKKIYSIKATAQMNSDSAYALKDSLKRGALRFLASENDATDILMNYKGYKDLPVEERVKMLSPFAQISSLQNEMINLEAEYNSNTGTVKLKEPRSFRKDRFSSVLYANWIASQLEKDLNRREEEAEDFSDYCFVI